MEYEARLEREIKKLTFDMNKLKILTNSNEIKTCLSEFYKNSTTAIVSSAAKANNFTKEMVKKFWQDEECQMKFSYS